MTLEGRFAAALDDIFSEARPRRLALAVSGGGDSMALMHLARDWAAGRGVSLEAATVDHGLRPESAREAELVAEAARALGVPHATLVWAGWDGGGNLQDAARNARRTLIEDWARPRTVDAILSGHTKDDQAETVLMRLARGSGVDGLAGMAPRQTWGETWARPLLGIRRAELREWLTARGFGWAEDPSNDDARFDRVKARRMLDELGGLGLTVQRLDATARHMRLAQEVLDGAARALSDETARTQSGDVLIALGGFREAPLETRTRLLAAAMCWVSGASYRPRYAALAPLALGREGGVLHGCLLTVEDGSLRVTRELAAVQGVAVPTNAVWDGRWRCDGPHGPGLEVRALTREGLTACPDWRATGLPATSLQATPAVWRGDDLVAAPVAGTGCGWTAALTPGRDEFSIAAHSR